MTRFEAIRHALTDLYVKGKFTVENPAIVKTADGYAYQSSEYPHEGIELDLKNGLPKTIQPKEAASIDDIAECIADSLEQGVVLSIVNDEEPAPVQPETDLCGSGAGCLYKVAMIEHLESEVERLKAALSRTCRENQ
jgi:hypothetical protein